MKVNKSKCEVLTVTRKRLPIVLNYTVHDQTLNRVKHTKYAPQIQIARCVPHIKNKQWVKSFLNIWPALQNALSVPILNAEIFLSFR